MTGCSKLADWLQDLRTVVDGGSFLSREPFRVPFFGSSLGGTLRGPCCLDKKEDPRDGGC